MERDPFPPAEFMEEGAPLFDWEEDALSKWQAVRSDLAASGSASAEQPRGEEESPAFSWWERIRRGV